MTRLQNASRQPIFQLLQSIPALCFLANDSGQHVICEILNDVFTEVSHDEKKEASYNKLLAAILKVSLLNDLFLCGFHPIRGLTCVF